VVNLKQAALIGFERTCGIKNVTQNGGEIMGVVVYWEEKQTIHCRPAGLGSKEKQSQDPAK